MIRAATAGVVASDGMGRHRGDNSEVPPDRAEILSRVLDLLDEVCLQVGGLIAVAAHEDLDAWNQWVERETPFTVEEARRLRAVYLAHTLFPPEKLERMPRPWQALWTIPAGRIGRGMPQAAHHTSRISGAEMLAARLLQEPADDLGSDVVAELVAWLHDRSG